MASLTPIHWWHWLPRPFPKWRIVGSVEAGDEVPDRLPHMSAVVIGPKQRPTWLAFDCPCPEGHRLMINLDSRRRPSWSIAAMKPLTIRPSLDDVTDDRRCHFFITKGKTVWVPNDRRSSS